MSTVIIEMDKDLKAYSDELNNKLELIDDIYFDCDELVDIHDVDFSDLNLLLSQYHELDFDNCNEIYTKIYELVMVEISNKTEKIKMDLLNSLAPYLGKNYENN